MMAASSTQSHDHTGHQNRPHTAPGPPNFWQQIIRPSSRRSSRVLPADPQPRADIVATSGYSVSSRDRKVRHLSRPEYDDASTMTDDSDTSRSESAMGKQNDYHNAHAPGRKPIKRTLPTSSLNDGDCTPSGGGNPVPSRKSSLKSAPNSRPGSRKSSAAHSGRSSRSSIDDEYKDYGLKVALGFQALAEKKSKDERDQMQAEKEALKVENRLQRERIKMLEEDRLEVAESLTELRLSYNDKTPKQWQGELSQLEAKLRQDPPVAASSLHPVQAHTDRESGLEDTGRNLAQIPTETNLLTLARYPSSDKVCEEQGSS